MSTLITDLPYKMRLDEAIKWSLEHPGESFPTSARIHHVSEKSIQSRVLRARRTTPRPGAGASDTLPPTQAFEWICYGDTSGRRRARAHVSRGLQRQKAAQAQNTPAKEEERNKSARSNCRQDSEIEHTLLKVSTTQPYDDNTGPYITEELAFQLTLGSGRGDPFACTPVNLGPRTQALLDHCTYDFLC